MCVCACPYTSRSATDSQAQIPVFLTSADTAAAAAGRMFVFGGEMGDRVQSNEVWSYNPILRTWKQELKSAAVSMHAPPAGKDYRMFRVHPKTMYGEHATDHPILRLVLLGSDARIIHCISIDARSGEVLGWDSTATTGIVPGLSADGERAMYRQFEATYIPGSVDSAGLIFLFGGITSEPKSALAADCYILTLSSDFTEMPVWTRAVARGRRIPTPRIGHSINNVRIRDDESGTLRDNVILFGGADTNSFRQDLYNVDTSGCLELEATSFQQFFHAPIHHSVTPIWNVIPPELGATAPGQFLVIGGIAPSDRGKKWSSQKLDEHASGADLVQVIHRIPHPTLTSQWKMFPVLTKGHKELPETWFGHTATHFILENFIIVYGGATTDHVLGEGECVWALWLGAPGKGALRGLTRKQERVEQEAARARRAHRSSSGETKVVTHTVKVSRRGAKQAKGHSGSESGSSGGGSRGSTDSSSDGDSDRGSRGGVLSKLFRLNGVDLTMGYKLSWERVSLPASPIVRLGRVGHAAVRWNEYMYVVGGYDEDESYSADVFRIPFGHLQPKHRRSDQKYLWQIGECAVEYCDPSTRQDLEVLREQMMSPRAGHSADFHDRYLWCFGGGVDGFALDNEVYRFDVDTYQWSRAPARGKRPEPRFNHSSCISPSPSPQLVICGGLANLRTRKPGSAQSSVAIAGSSGMHGHTRDVQLLDIWTMDLDGLFWSRVKLHEESALVPRSGHTMSRIRGSSKILIFGGSTAAMGSVLEMNPRG